MDGVYIRQVCSQNPHDDGAEAAANGKKTITRGATETLSFFITYCN